MYMYVSYLVHVHVYKYIVHTCTPCRYTYSKLYTLRFLLTQPVLHVHVDVDVRTYAHTCTCTYTFTCITHYMYMCVHKTNCVHGFLHVHCTCTVMYMYIQYLSLPLSVADMLVQHFYRLFCVLSLHKLTDCIWNYTCLLLPLLSGRNDFYPLSYTHRCVLYMYSTCACIAYTCIIYIHFVYAYHCLYAAVCYAYTETLY